MQSDHFAVFLFLIVLKIKFSLFSLVNTAVIHCMRNSDISLGFPDQKYTIAIAGKQVTNGFVVMKIISLLGTQNNVLKCKWYGYTQAEVDARESLIGILYVNLSLKLAIRMFETAPFSLQGIY